MSIITAFPLSLPPYNSRNNQFSTAFSIIEGDGEQFLNFPLIAFTPGFPLQAQELNELQENWEIQSSYDTEFLQNYFGSAGVQTPSTYGSNSALFIQPSSDVTTVINGDTVTITASNVVSVYDNGMRYWIKINPITNSVTLTSASVRFLKLDATIEYIPCSSDSSSIGFYFNDNSSGNFDSGTCGASRVRVSAETSTFVSTLQDNCFARVEKKSNGQIEVTLIAGDI